MILNWLYRAEICCHFAKLVLTCRHCIPGWLVTMSTYRRVQKIPCWCRFGHAETRIPKERPPGAENWNEVAMSRGDRMEARRGLDLLLQSLCLANLNASWSYPPCEYFLYIICACLSIILVYIFTFFCTQFNIIYSIWNENSVCNFTCLFFMIFTNWITFDYNIFHFKHAIQYIVRTGLCN